MSPNSSFHVIVSNTLYSTPQMSTWTKVIGVHHLGIMIICSTFHGNPWHSC